MTGDHTLTQRACALAFAISSTLAAAQFASAQTTKSDDEKSSLASS